MLGPNGEQGQNVQVGGDESLTIVEAPANPPVNLPSISDLPTPELGPNHTPAHTLPPNTVPGSDASKLKQFGLSSLSDLTTVCPFSSIIENQSTIYMTLIN